MLSKQTLDLFIIFRIISLLLLSKSGFESELYSQKLLKLQQCYSGQYLVPTGHHQACRDIHLLHSHGYAIWSKDGQTYAGMEGQLADGLE